MMRLLVLTVFALGICAIVNSEPCKISQPSCPHIEGTEGELTILPLITDCTKYILCQQGVAYVRPCPSNLVFNSDLKVCDFPNRTKCEPCEVAEKKLME